MAESQQYFSYIVEDSFIGRGNRSTWRKTTDLSQVSDKLYHIKVGFNNILVISWRSVFLVDETGVPGEKHRPVASLWQTLSHKSWFQQHFSYIVEVNFFGGRNWSTRRKPPTCRKSKSLSPSSGTSHQYKCRYWIKCTWYVSEVTFIRYLTSIQM